METADEHEQNVAVESTVIHTSGEGQRPVEGEEDGATDSSGAPGELPIRLNLSWLDTWDASADNEDPAIAAPAGETEMPWNAMLEAWSNGLGDSTSRGK